MTGPDMDRLRAFRMPERRAHTPAASPNTISPTADMAEGGS
jgi:hypothetical protein